MKSLEIVDDFVKYYDELLYGILRDHAPCCEGDLEEIMERRKKFLTIKADLGVLEIIKKKEVEVHHLQYFLDVYEGVDEIVLDHYNSFINEERQLTLEELLKLKQWLEENEND